MTGFFLFLVLLCLPALATLNILLAGLARAWQPPLPALLYSNSYQLHLFETNCADWLAVCSDRDRLLLEGLDTFSVAQWSPDGAFIAVKMVDGWMIYRADCVLNGQTCRPVRLDSRATDIRLAWGPDGAALAYMVDSLGGALRILTRGCWDGSPPSACVEHVVPIASLVTRLPDWSEDGSLLTFVSVTFDIYTVDMACLDAAEGCEDAMSPIVADPAGELWPSLSTDGTQVVYTSRAPGLAEQLFLTNLKSGERRQLTFGQADSTMPDWTADRYVAYAGFAEAGNRSMNIYVLDLQRGITVALVRNPERDMYPNWGPLPG